MDINKLKILFQTIKYLKFIQIYYRIYYLFRNKIVGIKPKKKLAPRSKKILWVGGILSRNSISSKYSFTFLNIKHVFSDQIDWNYSKYGKLWTYNLNYFDFLNQSDLSKDLGLKLILHYAKKENTLKDGKDPYPISIRGINWVKFLSKYAVQEVEIDEVLYHHYKILLKNLEYHLLGNHLLENAFSLLFGAYYFQNEKLYSKSKKILISQLNEQILADGAHFELSPMYHQIILTKLLDCIQLIKLNENWKNDILLSFLESKANIMLSFLFNITYLDGNIPMVNDSTYNIAASSKAIFTYAKELDIKKCDVPLSDSGLRKISTGKYELFIDVGNIGPDYQPGHAHSDTFNFELIKEGNPIIVDTGISTYEKNSKRQEERSTHAHNTVKIDNTEQSQIWDGFRVAKRAKIINLSEKNNFIEASHNGYLSQGYIHTRSFSWEINCLIIKDQINISTCNKSKAFFHLHSSIKKPKIIGNKILLNSSGVSIEFDKALSISIELYELSKGFNKTNLSKKIVVSFDKMLETKIYI